MKRCSLAAILRLASSMPPPISGLSRGQGSTLFTTMPSWNIFLNTWPSLAAFLRRSPSVILPHSAMLAIFHLSASPPNFFSAAISSADFAYFPVMTHSIYAFAFSRSSRLRLNWYTYSA